MKPVTSLFDFFQKVKRDRRYEKVAIKAYQESDYEKVRGGWREAKNWIDNWVIAHRNDTDCDGCGRMVRYLNNTMRTIPNWQDESLSEPRLDIPKRP